MPNHQGFSLSELLIAVAIAAGVTLAGMHLFSMQNRETIKMYSDSNITSTMFAIGKAVGNLEGCEETFVRPGNINPEGTGTSIEVIYSKKNGPAFQKNSPIGQIGSAHAVSISEMVVKNYMVSASNRGLADFYVTIRPKKGNPYTQKFVMGFTVKNSQIVGCFNPSEASIDCSGAWGSCTKQCDGGTQAYTVTMPEKNGGDSCPSSDQETRACNTHPCYGWVTSDWSACVGGSGSWSYSTWGACEGGRTVYSSGCGGGCAGPVWCPCPSSPICWETCSWLGTKSRSATCTFSSNSGNQTRTVTCQKEGVVVPDGNCSGVKPSSTQKCTPTDTGVCGKKLATEQDCPSLVKPNLCPADYDKEYCM